MEQNRRKYVRVDDNLQIVTSLIEPEEIDQEKLKLSQALPEGIDIKKWYPTKDDAFVEFDPRLKPIKAYLERLEYKLDMALQFIVLQQVEQGGFSEPIRCDISGGGMCYVSDREYQPGQILRVDILFKDFPPFIFSALAEVVRSEDNKNPSWSSHPYRVCVKFSEVSDQARESLILHVFQIQRKIIRDSDIISS